MPVEASICLGIIAYVFLIAGFTNIWLGSVNFSLNFKRSLRKSVILNKFIDWAIPKYGSWHHSCGIYPYKIYLFTVIMSLTNLVLASITVIINICLCFIIKLNVLYLCIIPTGWFVISLLSGIIIRIKCNPDPNPFH